MSTALDIVSKYDEKIYNLLIPIKTVTEIAEIQKPVMNVVYISTNLDDKEIYIQEKESKGYYDENKKWVSKYEPPRYALAKKGLNKLARAAGINTPETRPVIPSTCQKCIAVNGKISTAVKCGECKNLDVKFQAKISVPQLTGENIEYVAHKELSIVGDTVGMSEKQKGQYIKFRNEICETKALNRALRAALLVKPTYLLEELQKPFVVAYLVLNLNDPDVKAAVLQKYSQSVSNLFGNQEPQPKIINLTDEDDGNSVNPIQNESQQPVTNNNPAIHEEKPNQNEQQSKQSNSSGYVCIRCAKGIQKKVFDYSTEHYEKPLCFDCQRLERRITVNQL